MWILPKQIISACAPGTVELISDSVELSEACAQSLFVRSKPSPSRTWSLKWKRDSWTQLLSGRILRLSTSESFTDWWTSSLGATLANPSPQQESEKGKKTNGTSGPGSQMVFDFVNQPCASSKTSKDISRWDSPQSSATWKKWVTRCRGEYSARLKSAPRTSANGSSFLPREMGGCSTPTDSDSASWPTPRTTDTQAGRGCVQIGKGLYRPSQALAEGKLVGGANLADAVTGEGWPTPRTQDSKHGKCTQYELGRDKGKDLLHVRVEREEKNWPTPQARENDEDPKKLEERMRKKGREGSEVHMKLSTSVKMWPTATARDWKDSPGMSTVSKNPDGSVRNRTDLLPRAVYALGQQGQDNSNSGGSHRGSSDQSQQNWQTFAPGTNCRGETPHRQVVKALVNGEKLKTQCLTVDQVFAEEIKGTNKQRETWPTPVVTDSIGSGNRNLEGSKAHAGESLTDVVNGGQKARVSKNTGKLNPRWVETLMGVPVGWTMPSCTSPVTIEPTS